MKVAILNMTTSGSTGKIVNGIAEAAGKSGHTVNTFSTKRYSRGVKEEYPAIQNHTYFGYMWEQYLHYLLARIIGFNGCFSVFGTMSLISKLKKYKPDILNIHNIHSYCICLPLLFRYIKKSGVKVVWTLHDCWLLTGQCPHFLHAKCDKWKTGCYACTQINEYPKTASDRSKKMWQLKNKWFSESDNISFIAPSKWLAGIARQSYLNSKKVEVIYNGIDLNVFKPTKGDFREKHNLANKKIVLGVAFSWGEKKGLDVFVELSKRLGDEYQIVLVGVDENIKKALPNNIICVHRTKSQHELAEIYTAADVFVNPTREEVLGLVNIEAMACGTPVVSFDAGGSPETYDEKSGVTVGCDNIDEMESEILRCCTQMPFKAEDCVKRAGNFDKTDKFNEYIVFFEGILKNR